MARPKIEWSEKDFATFEGLCSIQCTENEIENILKISIETVDRLCKEHYRSASGKPLSFSEVYKKYADQGKMSLRRYQFRLAEKNATMAIWLGKQYLGQRDQPIDNIDTEDTDAYFGEAGLNDGE